MSIHSENNIYVPGSSGVIRGDIDINIKPECHWFVEIQDTDGTIRPAKCCEGGKWIKNTMTNGFKDQFCGGFGSFLSVQEPTILSWLWTASVTPVLMAIGTSNTAAAATQTTLQAYSKAASGLYPVGNSLQLNTSNGNLVGVVKQSFPAEVGSQTYYEAGLSIGIGSNPGIFLVNTPSASGGTGAGSVLANRVVFGGGIAVTVGQTIIMTMAVSVPSIYNSPQTVTLSASNGINMSGQLAMVGTAAQILGGSVTLGGTMTTTDTSVIFPRVMNQLTNGLSTNHVFALTGHNSIITAGTAGTNMSSGTTNSIVAAPATTNLQLPYAAGSFTTAPYTTGVGGSYAGSGAFNRTVIGYWAIGNPASTTTYNSLCFSYLGTMGYQLLFTTPQSFSNVQSVQFGLNFAIA